MLNGFDIGGRVLVKAQVVSDLPLVGYDLPLVKLQVARSVRTGRSPGGRILLVLIESIFSGREIINS